MTSRSEQILNVGLGQTGERGGELYDLLWLNTVKQKGLQSFHLLSLCAVTSNEQDYDQQERDALH